MTLHLSPEELAVRHKAQQKVWREAHPDKVRAYHRKYAAKDDVKERKRDFERANRERINERRRELYRLRNPLPTPAEENDSHDQPTDE
jgi:hypothetical protein